MRIPYLCRSLFSTIQNFCASLSYCGFFFFVGSDNLEFSENRFSTAKCVFEHLGRNVWGYFALGLSLNRIAPVCLINLKYKAWISCKFSHSSFHVSFKNVTQFFSKNLFFDVFNLISSLTFQGHNVAWEEQTLRLREEIFG